MMTMEKNHNSRFPNSYGVSYFADGEIVWAKMKQYPWWPATVLSRKVTGKEGNKKLSFIVEFMGEPREQGEITLFRLRQFTSPSTLYQRFSSNAKDPHV